MKSQSISINLKLELETAAEAVHYSKYHLHRLFNLDEKNELYNRYMHISGLWSDKKVDIHTEEVDIRDLEVDIESFFADKTVGFSGKTQSHIRQMFEKFGFDKIFGRSAVVELLGLQNSSVSKLLSKLSKAEIIEPVSGHGKGKYRFARK